MNKQTKFYLELLSLKKFYEDKLKLTKAMRYVHKINATEEIIKIYKNN
jgi:hypothetical protein